MPKSPNVHTINNLGDSHLFFGWSSLGDNVVSTGQSLGGSLLSFFVRVLRSTVPELIMVSAL